LSATPGGVDTRYKYTGRELDQETGLYYYRARYFDANVGRFIGQDPIGFSAGDSNLYRYVENNSINAIDPFGLYKIEVEYDPTPFDASSQHHARVIFIRGDGRRVAYEAIPSEKGSLNASRNASGFQGTSGFLVPNPTTFGKIDHAPAPPHLNQFIYERKGCTKVEEIAIEKTIRKAFEDLVPAKIKYSTFSRNSNSAAFHALRTVLPSKYIYPKVAAPAWEINPFTGREDPRAFGIIDTPEKYPERPARSGRPTAY
jgi:RHS repeat-associated protein